MASELLNYEDYAHYLSQCRRFLERANPDHLPRLAPVIIRIIDCIANCRENIRPRDAAIIDEMMHDGRYCEAIITTVSCLTNFTSMRGEDFSFIFTTGDQAMRSVEVKSQSNSYVYALASSYIYTKFLDVVQPKNDTELR